ncbi:hypothetical protein FNV64_41860 [Streptomyces sp. S1A1-7]|uniref:hypothetical protein n=1 Tax=Streptomyces sp. S1A1-7 TaxID=2594459 RepID=UPI0011655759|nr:hypothetical protein [Streptomyces sp. S1A1-7]QDN81262.1 hypothetical protein FNV64_41860 [Streptomyces sp. S1A1-7]
MELNRKAEITRDAITNAAEIRVTLAAVGRHLKAAIRALETGQPVDPAAFYTEFDVRDGALLRANLMGIPTGSVVRALHLLYGNIAWEIAEFASGRHPLDLDRLRMRLADVEDLETSVSEDFNRALKERFQIDGITLPVRRSWTRACSELRSQDRSFPLQEGAGCGRPVA